MRLNLHDTFLRNGQWYADMLKIFKGWVRDMEEQAKKNPIQSFAFLPSAESDAEAAIYFAGREYRVRLEYEPTFDTNTRCNIVAYGVDRLNPAAPVYKKLRSVAVNSLYEISCDEPKFSGIITSDGFSLLGVLVLGESGKDH